MTGKYRYQMPESRPDSPDNFRSRLAGLAMVIALLFVLLVLVIGFIPESGPLSDPAIARMRSVSSQSWLTLNTTTVDRDVGISIEQSSIRGGGKGGPRRYDDLVIGITNYHNYDVLVSGECRYVDTFGRQISSVPFPPDSSAYHILYSPYYVPAGEKMSYRFFLHLYPPDDLVTSPPLDVIPNQEYRIHEVITCSILNVSRASTTG